MTGQAKSSTVPQGGARLLRYLAMPIFLGLACLALYLYVSSQNLDSIERRSLNPSAIIQQTGRLIELAGISTVIVVVLAVTTGILLTRPYTRRVTPFVIALANIGQAVPSIGLLALFALTWDFGFWPAIVALVAYSFLSILRNTMVGLEQVDRSTIEAARRSHHPRRHQDGPDHQRRYSHAGDVHRSRRSGRDDQQRHQAGPDGSADHRQRADRHFGPVHRLAGQRGRRHLAPQGFVMLRVEVFCVTGD